jgi:hypothetical protein
MTETQSRRTGTVVKVGFGAIALGTIVTVLIVPARTVPVATGATTAESLWLAGPTAEEIEEIFRLAGVSPKSIAAGGVRPSDVAGIVEDGLEDLLPSYESIAQAKTGHALVRAQFERLDRLVRGGRATEQERADRDAAAQALSQSRGELDAALESLRAAVVSSLPAGQAGAILSVAAQRGYALPAEYLTVVRDGSEWVSLRDALADIRIADRLGRSPAPLSVQTVLQADAHPRVAAAKVGLESLAQVRAAWDEALGR